MAAKREVYNLLCVFNLSIYKVMHLDRPISTRVLLIYDKNKNKKEIKVLHKGITEEMRGRLALWLEKNVEIDDILYNLRSKEINIDELKKASNY